MSRLLIFAALCCIVMMTCSAVGGVTLQAEGDACYAMAAAIPGLKTLAGDFNIMQYSAIECNMSTISRQIQHAFDNHLLLSL